MATEGFASRLESVAVHAKETLADLGYPWALVGGLAVSARAEPRFTRDVDFAVALKGDRELPGGYRVVTRERLGRELIGAVGPRADLFALYEKAEEAASPG